MVIIIRYVVFAIVSTLANIATQQLFHHLTPIFPLAISIGMGTVVGFGVKYLMDKRWIFDHVYIDYVSELQTILLYGIFSVVTTLIFWAFEVASWMAWHTDVAKYAGATLGLSIGYTAKYVLDRNFVFNKCDNPLRPASSGASAGAP